MKRKGTIVRALAAAMLVLSVVFTAAASFPVEAEAASETPDGIIRVLDYGATGMVGDAVLIESDGHYILMDTGYTDSKSNLRNSSVIRYLKKHGITELDLYLSHYHNDHYYLFTTIMKDDDFKVGTFYIPKYDNLLKWTDPKYKSKKWYSYFTKNVNTGGRKSWENGSLTQILSTAKSRNINLEVITRGAKFSVGNAQFEVLWHNTSRGISGNWKTACTKFLNNESLVTRVTIGNVRYLTCGDIESEVENELVKKGIDIKADICKSNHHSGKTSNTSAFYNKVKPTYVFGTGYHTNLLKTRAKTYKFNYASMKNNGELTYKIYGDEIVFSAKKGTKTGKRLIRLADGTRETRTFTFASGTTGQYKAKMIPAGAKYLGTPKWETVKGKKYYYDGEARVKDGFYTVDKKTYYFDKDSVMKTKWITVGGLKYYCGTNGVVQTGWKTIDGNKYYLDPDNGGAAATGDRMMGEARMRFDDNGVFLAMVLQDTQSAPESYIGLGQVGEDTYGFKNGRMVKGWLTVDSKTYYFGEDGIIRKGVLQLGDKFYYLGENTGVLKKNGWAKTSEGIWYNADKNGVLKSGWQTINKKKYYFRKTNRQMVTGVHLISGKYYYFHSKDGNLIKNAWHKDADGNRFFTDKNGVCCSGWKTINKKKYYFDPATKAAAKGFTVIGGKEYYFNASDNRMEVRWTKPADGGKCYCGNDGVIRTGWKTVDKKNYYFDPENHGIAKTGIFSTAENPGAWFYADGDGVLKKNGWCRDKDGNKVCYAKADGVLLVGTQTVGGVQYIFGEDGRFLGEYVEEPAAEEPEETTKPEAPAPAVIEHHEESAEPAPAEAPVDGTPKEETEDNAVEEQIPAEGGTE